MKIQLAFLLTVAVSSVSGQPGQKQDPADFVPKGYRITERIKGDLNKDGVDDCVLMIQATDKTKFIINDQERRVNRNRRGIIVLLHKNEHYELAVKNYNCFSSDQEDGGGYLPPDLVIEINKGLLFAHYGHGRYGYWRYMFRYQNADLELIGYEDSDEHWPLIRQKTSINFLTKKKLLRINTNEDAKGGDEIFKETWTKININKLIKLSEIKDFDELDMSVY